MGTIIVARDVRHRAPFVEPMAAASAVAWHPRRSAISGLEVSVPPGSDGEIGEYRVQMKLGFEYEECRRPAASVPAPWQLRSVIAFRHEIRGFSHAPFAGLRSRRTVVGRDRIAVGSSAHRSRGDISPPRRRRPPRATSRVRQRFTPPPVLRSLPRPRRSTSPSASSSGPRSGGQVAATPWGVAPGEPGPSWPPQADRRMNRRRSAAARPQSGCRCQHRHQAPAEVAFRVHGPLFPDPAPASHRRVSPGFTRPA